jgi:hypothetical protein
MFFGPGALAHDTPAALLDTRHMTQESIAHEGQLVSSFTLAVLTGTLAAEQAAVVMARHPNAAGAGRPPAPPARADAVESDATRTDRAGRIRQSNFSSWIRKRPRLTLNAGRRSPTANRQLPQTSSGLLMR